MSDRQKVLCIEDDPQTLELLVEFLAEAGFEPVMARDGVEGVEKFAARPDAILCDIDMPGMDGFGVLQALRRASGDLRDVPFLFITAFGGPDVDLRARRLGSDDVIAKPLDFEMLVEILRSRLAPGQRQTPPVELTTREREIMTWVSRGKSSSDIAVIVRMSERTVNFHVANVLRKLGVATRIQAAIRCALLGLVDP